MKSGFKSLLMAISLMACPVLAACGGDGDSDAETDASTELDASTEADASTEVDAGPSTCAHDCGEHGVCLNDGTGMMCHCVNGYAGDACDACAEGYQDNDKDGTCLPDCGSANLSCGERQKCDDSNGKATCKLMNGKWTVMVYLDGDNNLGATGASDFAHDDLMEMADGMKSAGAKGDDINVIVLFDETEDEDSKLTDDVEEPGDTRVYKVSRDGVALLDSGNKIFRNGEADMSSSKTLQKFGTWAVENFPADHYALVLWDHGDGWRDGPDGKPGSHCDGMKKFGILPGGSAASAKGFASDDSASSQDSMIHIHNGEYTDALKAIKKQAGKNIDLVGFDACLMGMYEVAAFTKPYADFMVASSETIPGTGWDYASVMGALGRDPDMGASDLGKAVVDAYMDFVYEDEDSGLSIYIDPVMGLYDLSKMDALNVKLGAVAAALNAPFDELASLEDDDPAVEGAAARLSSLLTTLGKIIGGDLQKFAYAEHVDLRHFLELLAAAGTQGGVPQAALDAIPAALAALEDAVPYHRNRSCSDDDDFCYFDYSYEHANGMAIFFPHGLNCRVDATGDVGPFSSTQEFYDSIEELGVSSVMAYSDYLCTDFDRTGLYSAWEILNCYVGESASTFAPGWGDFLFNAVAYGTVVELNASDDGDDDGPV